MRSAAANQLNAIFDGPAESIVDRYRITVGAAAATMFDVPTLSEEAVSKSGAATKLTTTFVSLNDRGSKRSVKLGIEAPNGIRVIRGELVDQTVMPEAAAPALTDHFEALSDQYPHVA